MHWDWIRLQYITDWQIWAVSISSFFPFQTDFTWLSCSQKIHSYSWEHDKGMWTLYCLCFSSRHLSETFVNLAMVHECINKITSILDLKWIYIITETLVVKHILRKATAEIQNRKNNHSSTFLCVQKYTLSRLLERNVISLSLVSLIKHTRALNTHSLYFLSLIDHGYRINGASRPFSYSYAITFIFSIFLFLLLLKLFKTNSDLALTLKF